MANKAASRVRELRMNNLLFCVELREGGDVRAQRLLHKDLDRRLALALMLLPKGVPQPPLIVQQRPQLGGSIWFTTRYVRAPQVACCKRDLPRLARRLTALPPRPRRLYVCVVFVYVHCIR